MRLGPCSLVAALVLILVLLVTGSVIVYSDSVV